MVTMGFGKIPPGRTKERKAARVVRALERGRFPVCPKRDHVVF
jgi:hypothetical protein